MRTHLIAAIILLSFVAGCGYKALVRDVVEAVDQPVQKVSSDFKRKKLTVEYYNAEDE